MMYTQPYPWIGLRKLIHFSLTLAALSLAAPLFAAPFAYVAGSNTVLVIDTATNTVVTTISGFSGNVAITPDGAFAYVAGGTVTVIATATNKVVATTTIPGGAYGVAITPDGAFAYVVGLSNNVTVIATATNNVVATIQVGISPRGIAITPNGAFAYVVNSGSNSPGGPASVSVIATATKAVVATIPVGRAPLGIAITPNGAFAYVTNSQEFVNIRGTVSVISTATNKVVETISVGFGAVAVAIAPDGAFAYVANQGFSLETETVSVIATATNNVVATIPVGGAVYGQGPTNVAITPDGAFAYVTTYNVLFENGPGTVSVIATATNKVVATIQVGIQPFGVAITPLPQPLLSVSVTPNSGSGANQIFAFHYADSKGFASLTNVYAGFGPTAYVEHSCRVEYYRGINKLYLKNDAGTAFLGPLTPGLPGTLSNSQCTLDAGKSSVAGSGDILTLNLAFSFKPTFVGMQGIFSYAIDKSGLTTPGRQKVGTWDVTP